MTDELFNSGSSRFSGPYKSPENYHRHMCNFCAYIWEHHDCNDVSHNASPGSHECPSCHRCNWQMGIYNGPVEPKIRNGKTLVDEAPK